MDREHTETHAEALHAAFSEGVETNTDIRELKTGVRRIQENMATKADLQCELRYTFVVIVVYGMALLGAAGLLFS